MPAAAKTTREKLRQANEALFQLQQEKEYFTGIASHDLKQPLSVIGLMSETLLTGVTGPLNPEQKNMLGLIQEASKEMMQLISNYLTASRFESGSVSPRRRSVNITELAGKILSRYRATAEQKNIILSLDAALGICLDTDTDYLSRILENLLSNAIKYSLPGKPVTIQISSRAGYIEMAVRDEGVGIRKKELPRLFEKFQQLSSRPTGGELSTGLGLHITRFLVEQLNGTIEARSQWKKGTTFSVRLPVDKK